MKKFFFFYKTIIIVIMEKVNKLMSTKLSKNIRKSASTHRCQLNEMKQIRSDRIALNGAIFFRLMFTCVK